MRKEVALFLAFLLALLWSGCSSQDMRQSTGGIDAADDTAISGSVDVGDFSYTSSSGAISYSFSDLPRDMDFGGKLVPLNRVTFFESYGNHGYVGYVVVSMSRENLTDDDIYWMTNTIEIGKNREIDVNVYVDESENGLDSDLLHLEGKIYSEYNLYYIFSSELQRYSFKGGSVNCQIIYCPTSLTEPDTVYYYYDFEIDDIHYSDSIDVLTAEEASVFNQALTD